VSEPQNDRDRQERIIAAALKVVGVAVAIGLTIGLGTWVLVKALDLDTTETVSLGPGPVEPRPQLPSSALPDPENGGGTPEPEPTPTPTPTNAVPGGADGELYLNASPVFVGPMERINLTGQWPGRDAMSLLVQRFEDGEWVDFGVQVQVRIGGFATYVMTGREGDNRFRVYDPSSDTASNEVTVTIE